MLSRNSNLNSPTTNTLQSQPRGRSMGTVRTSDCHGRHQVRWQGRKLMNRERERRKQSLMDLIRAEEIWMKELMIEWMSWMWAAGEEAAQNTHQSWAQPMIAIANDWVVASLSKWRTWRWTIFWVDTWPETWLHRGGTERCREDCFEWHREQKARQVLASLNSSTPRPGTERAWNVNLSGGLIWEVEDTPPSSPTPSWTLRRRRYTEDHQCCENISWATPRRYSAPPKPSNSSIWAICWERVCCRLLARFPYRESGSVQMVVNSRLHSNSFDGHHVHVAECAQWEGVRWRMLLGEYQSILYRRMVVSPIMKNLLSASSWW